MYAVHVEYDGCTDERALYSHANRACCLLFISRNWSRYSKGKQTLALLNLNTGRLESFVLYR